MQYIGLILIIALVVVLNMFFYARYNRKIEEKMMELGVSDYDSSRQWGFVSIGPFKWVGKGQTVYKISYEKDGHFKELWVKFGALGGPVWKEF